MPDILNQSRKISNFTFLTDIFLYSDIVQQWRGLQKCKRTLVYSRSIAFIFHQGVIDAVYLCYSRRKRVGEKLSVLGVDRPDRSPREFLILSRESRRKVSTAWRWRPKLATSVAATRFAFLAPRCIRKGSLDAPCTPDLYAFSSNPAAFVYMSLSLSLPLFLLALSRR